MTEGDREVDRLEEVIDAEQSPPTIGRRTLIEKGFRISIPLLFTVVLGAYPIASSIRSQTDENISNPPDSQVPLLTEDLIPPVKDWPEITLRADGTSQQVPGVEVLQQPKIGLTRLELILDPNIPLIAVVSMWDQHTNKSYGHPIPALRSKYALDGIMWLQSASDPFQPRYDSEASIDVSNLISQDYMRRLMSVLGRIRGINEYPNRVEVTSYNPGSEALTLVFGDEFIEYNGNLSPQSFLAAKFSIESPPQMPFNICNPTCPSA